MNPGSSTRAQDFLQRDKFFSALRADGQVVLHAGEGFVERQASELALGKFTDTALILAAIEIVFADIAYYLDQLLDLFGRKWFPKAKVVRRRRDTNGRPSIKCRYGLMLRVGDILPRRRNEMHYPERRLSHVPGCVESSRVSSAPCRRR